MRYSMQYRQAEKKWIGKRIKYYVREALRKGNPLSGPYYGTVTGISANDALIEDRREGHTHRNSADFTGFLIVKPDGLRQHDAYGRGGEDWVLETLAEVVA